MKKSLIALTLLMLGNVVCLSQPVKISVKPQKPIIAEGETHANVLIRLKADKGPNQEKLKKINLSLVIDRSGSMRGQKIIDARDSAINMVKKLRNGDVVSIISYSDDVTVDVEPTEVDDAAKIKIEAIIHTIGDGGGTNLGGGLAKGIEKANKFIKGADVSRVLLISDGLANKGIIDPAALNKISRESLQGGVVVTTLGLGVDYNEDLMTSVADNGGGNYYFVEKSEDIVATLDKELSQMASTVGKGLVLKNKLAAGVKLEEMYGWIFKDEGAKISANLGEIFAEQNRTILCKFKLPDGLKKGQEVAIHPFELMFHSLNDGDKQLVTIETEMFKLKVSDDGKAILAAQDMEVTARVAEIQLATRIENVTKLVEERKFDDAKKLITEAVEGAKKDAAKIPEKHLKRLVQATEEAEKMVIDVEKAEKNIYEQKRFIKGGKEKAYWGKK